MANDWADAIEVALERRGRASTRLLIGSVLLILFVLDASTAVLLRQMPALVSVDEVDWKPHVYMHELAEFSSAMSDMMLLFVARWLLMLSLLYLGVRFGTPKLDDIGKPGATCPPCAPTQPLLINGENETRLPGSGDAPLEHLESHKRKREADRRKNAILAVTFAVSTIAQVFVGVKCISFVGAWPESETLLTAQGALLGVTVALINAESFVVTRLINILTAEEGFLVPEFHEHRLFFTAGLPGHWCDLCRVPSNDMYRCRTCDWDACPACFKKKDKSTGEGVMRGDKGVKSSTDVGRWAYFRRAVRLVAPHVPLFLVALGCLVATSVVNLFLPNFQGEIFDHVIDAHHSCTGGNVSAVEQDACDTSRGLFFSTVTMYLVLSVALGALASLKALSFSIVSRRMAIWIRKRLFRIMMKQDIAFFDGMRTGDLQSRVSEDISQMVAPIQYSLSQFLSNIITLVGGVAMCFVTSWRLSMIAFTTVLPMSHVTSVYAEWSGKINSQRYQLLSDAQSRMGESITNMRTVRAVSSEEHESALNDKTLTKCLEIGVRDACYSSLTEGFNSYLDLGAGVLILWYGGTIAMAPQGAISIGALIKFQLYWNMINTSIQALNDMVNSFTRAAGAAERVLSLYDLTPDMAEGGDDADACLGRWDLAFENVVFRYQMRPLQTVLQGVSFTVPEGSVCALVGRSGGGKSTLVHLCLRFYDPVDGRVTLGGRDLRELRVDSVHRRVGIVSQESQLFNTTLLDNIRYGAFDASVDDVRTACEAAQAWGFISEFEDGLATRVGERGQRLSGGQRQRIAIARCLLRKPRLLLLDEATSALDAESEALVQKALDALIWTGEHTVMLVAHRLSTVVNANKIVVLDKGRAVEQGTHDELVAKRNGVYASLVAHQLRKQAEVLSEAAPQAQTPADNVDALFDDANGGGGGSGEEK